MRKLVVFILLIGVFAAMVPVSAQDGLSDEEIALIDRALAAGDAQDDLDSYEFIITEERALNMSITVQGQDLLFNEGFTLTTEGYYLYADNVDQVLADSELVFNGLSPDGPVDYTLTTNAVSIDEILFVNAILADGDYPDGDIPDGWITIESAEDIPEVLADFGFDDIFDEDEEDDPIEDREKLITYASQVTLEEDELDDGTPIEVIAILIEGENLAEFYTEILPADSDDPMTQAFYNSEIGGNIIIAIALDGDENVVGTGFFMNMIIDSVDLVGVPDLPEGTTVAMDASFSEISEYANLNGEFPAIEAPIE